MLDCPCFRFYNYVRLLSAIWGRGAGVSLRGGGRWLTVDLCSWKAILFSLENFIRRNLHNDAEEVVWVEEVVWIYAFGKSLSPRHFVENSRIKTEVAPTAKSVRIGEKDSRSIEMSAEIGYIYVETDTTLFVTHSPHHVCRQTVKHEHNCRRTYKNIATTEKNNYRN